MHVLVVTCAHRGDDARIAQRQVPALLAGGHRVTLVAPGPQQRRDGLVHVEVRRAVGRRRPRAWIDVLRAIHDVGDADVMVVHDLELVPLLAWSRVPRCRVWDVHEDLAASVADRGWIPGALRRVVAAAVRAVERWAPRRYRLVAAETGYRDRLGDVPVVPNSTWVPPRCPAHRPGDRRVVYVGRISRARGWDTMAALARTAGGEVTLELFGEADADVRPELEQLAADGQVVWHGYVDNDRALTAIEGSLAGLALLADLPNYRHSMPTKIAEYFARGVPVVTSPLPIGAALVNDSGAGIVVDEGDVERVREYLRALLADEGRRAAEGAAGHRYAAEHLNWDRDGRAFADLLASWSAAGATP